MKMLLVILEQNIKAFTNALAKNEKQFIGNELKWKYLFL